MRKAFRANRALLLIVALATSLTVITSAAVGLASSPDEISLTIGSNSGQFEYDDLAPQLLESRKSSCRLDLDSTDGPIMELDATTFARNGNPVDPAPIGLVGGRLGVNKNGNGNDSSCGRVDWLRDGQSETLTMTLGSAIGTKVMESAAFSLDSKSGDTVQFEFFLDEQPLGSSGYVTAGSGVDVSPPAGSPFDAVRISAGSDSNIGITGATFSLRDLVAAVPTITVQSRDEVTQIGSDALFDFTIDNTASEVAAGVKIREVGFTALDCDLTAAAGAIAYCSGSRTVDEVVNSISFEALVSVPTLGTQTIPVTPAPLSYLGGYACGEAIVADGPDVTGDGPDVGFVLGPDKAGDPTDCAVPVEITTTGVGGSEQTATVEPPATYTWTDVTGVVTIAWDAVAPDDADVARTLQVLSDNSEDVIPWCADIVPVTLRTDENYELTDQTFVSSSATGAGDVCLILQSTQTVDADGIVLTQTTEAFYIWKIRSSSGADPRVEVDPWNAPYAQRAERFSRLLRHTVVEFVRCNTVRDKQEESSLVGVATHFLGRSAGFEGNQRLVLPASRIEDRCPRPSQGHLVIRAIVVRHPRFGFIQGRQPSSRVASAALRIGQGDGSLEARRIHSEFTPPTDRCLQCGNRALQVAFDPVQTAKELVRPCDAFSKPR